MALTGKAAWDFMEEVRVRSARERPEEERRARFEQMYYVVNPQAPLDQVLAILAVHGALGPDGQLAPDVVLVSIGDHFD